MYCMKLSGRRALGAPARDRCGGGTRLAASGHFSLLAGGGALEQQAALARILRERRRTLKLAARFLVAAEPGEEIAAHARQQVIGTERALGLEPVDRKSTRLNSSHSQI